MTETRPPVESHTFERVAAAVEPEERPVEAGERAEEGGDQSDVLV